MGDTYRINSVALCGYGYWGKNLARVLHKLGVLTAIVDENKEALDRARADYPGKAFCTGLPSNIAGLFDGFIIATPPETHYSLAAETLERGLNVFVEKPLATRASDAEDLERLATQNKLHLATGHIYLNCPGLMAIPISIGKSQLYMRLLNVGGAPSNSTRDLIWAGMPHAASVAAHFFQHDYPTRMTVMSSNKGNRVQAWLSYFDGSEAILDVGDFTGIRKRDVEFRVGGERYTFNVDKPYKHTAWYSRQEYITLDTPKEILELEIIKFLNKEVIGPPGSLVVRLVEDINILKEKSERDSNGEIPNS